MSGGNLLTNRASHARLRRERKAAGLCMVCGKVPAEPKRVRCAACRVMANKATRAYMKRLRVIWKLLGVCPVCGCREKVRGESRCAWCAELDNEAKVLKRAKQRMAA